jgi:indole-3-glycerol phosphate synthase
MNILEQIIADKRIKVAERKQQVPVAQLEQYGDFKKLPLSLKALLKDEVKTGIIAEFKRASPSKGLINGTASVAEVTGAYAAGGASGISVLTDETYFNGTLQDLAIAVKTGIPVLRKDFMIDDYQIVEAKAYGASVILLIAACLSPAEVRSLARTARNVGLEVLLELHDETELDHVCSEIDLVGINNRNLKTFSVDLEQSIRLAHQLDDSFPKIAESGISSVENIRYLKQRGFDGFLIGEHFMKQPEPGIAFQQFVTTLNAVPL